MDLSVVIPAWNEAGNIGPLVRGLHAVCDELNLKREIIVVDGGSKDTTVSEAEKAGATVFVQRRVGYGGALRDGLLKAQGRYILTLDSDQSHPPELFKVLWNARHEADVLIGSRFVPGGSSDAPLFRHLLSKVLNGIFSSVLSVPLKDLSSGYRLYKREVLRPRQYRPENFNILQEIIVTAYSDGYSVKEVPLNYLPRGEGSSHVSLIKFAISYLPTLYRLWMLRNSFQSADYEERAFRSRHLLQRRWQHKRHQIISKLVQDGETLDIGCGSSKFTLEHSDVIAADAARGKLRFLKSTHQRRVQSVVEALPFSNGSFDTVVLSQVLNFTSDPKAALIEAARVLKDHGRVVLSVPDSRRIQWRMFRMLYSLLPNVYAREEKQTFNRFELVDQLADLGFRVLKYYYIFGAELIISAEKM